MFQQIGKVSPFVLALTLTSQYLVSITFFFLFCAEWQIYVLLLGLFLASVVAFYIFFQNSDSFWKFPLPSSQPGKPKIGAFLGDPQSSDDQNMWNEFGPLDMWPLARFNHQNSQYKWTFWVLYKTFSISVNHILQYISIM